MIDCIMINLIHAFDFSFCLLTVRHQNLSVSQKSRDQFILFFVVLDVKVGRVQVEDFRVETADLAGIWVAVLTVRQFSVFGWNLKKRKSFQMCSPINYSQDLNNRPKHELQTYLINRLFWKWTFTSVTRPFCLVKSRTEAAKTRAHSVYLIPFL